MLSPNSFLLRTSPIIKNLYNRKESFISGNGLMDKKKDMARLIFLMEAIFLAHSKMERQKVKEDYIIPMEITIMGNGKMINHTVLASTNL